MKIEKYVEKSPIFAILNASHRINSSIKKNFDKLGLNHLEAIILVGLYFEKPGSVTPSELASALKVSRASISQSITSLQKKKMAQRNSVSEDARRYRITLTSSGLQKVNVLIKLFDAFQNSIEQRVGLRRTEELAQEISGLYSFL